MKKYRVNMLPRSVADLDEIHVTIAADDPKAADRLIRKIISQINRLTFMPERYGVAPEAQFFKVPLRHVTVWPYRIVYRVDADAVEVVTIRHGKRRPLQPGR